MLPQTAPGSMRTRIGEFDRVANDWIRRSMASRPSAQPNETWYVNVSSPMGLVRPALPRPVPPLPQRARRRSDQPKAELLRSEDVARIIPLSVRQIEQMAAEGHLPGFKLPGCALLLFDETVVRQQISIYVSALKPRGVTPCLNSVQPKTRTIISTQEKGFGTSATNWAEFPTGSRLGHLMSGRRGKSATAS